MTTHDFTQLISFYPECIATMPGEFTSHRFILELARRHQVEYVEALYAYRIVPRAGKYAPFMMVHSVLARALEDFSSLIQKVGVDTTSRDIFGEQQSATLWRKL